MTDAETLPYAHASQWLRTCHTEAILAMVCAHLLACTQSTTTHDAGMSDSNDAGPRNDAGARNDATTSNEATAELHANFANTLGTLDPRLFGTTSAPHPDDRGFEAAKAAGFRLTSVSVNMPFPTDPSDANTYDFSELDDQVGRSVAADLDVLVIFAPEDTPANLDAYGTYAANVARHLTKGWGNGHTWPITLFRFGNEPNDDARPYWHGTRQEFFDTYAAWTRALTDVDASFLFDVPGVASARDPTDPDEVHPWIPAILEYCQDNDVPVDYLSFHTYSQFLPAFYDDTALVKGIVDTYSSVSPHFGTARIANDEWNMALGDQWSGHDAEFFHTEWPAPTLVGGLINMIDAGLSLSVPMFGTFNGGVDGCHDFPIVECDGTPKATYYALEGLNELAGLERIALSGYDRMNLTALAAKSDDAVIVVIANQDIRGFIAKFEPEGSPSHAIVDDLAKTYGDATYDRFRLDIADLPWARVHVERAVVDAEHELEIVDTRDLARGEAYEAAIGHPSVHIVRITAAR